jgi:NADH-quinone oxidoreductase subunit F
MTEVKEKKTEEIKKEAEEIRCPVKRALYYIEEFLSGPMCGKCFPCEFGSYEAKIILQNIIAGKGTESDLLALRKIADEMLEISRCKKGKDTAKFILEWMGTDAYKEHIEGRCPEKECKALIEYRIIPEKCIMCGLCQEACKDNAIIGEKKVSYRSGYLPFEIRQKRCTKCGECIKVCPVEAIEIIDVKVKETETVSAGK